MTAERPESFSYALQELGISESLGLEEANERLIEAGLSDGLPLIPPTEERIERFFWGLDADPNADIEATLMPSFRSPRLWEVAAVAVMAGCLPSYLPVIVAALRAMAEEPYNLLGVQCTTSTATPIVAVHGPIAAELGINGADNCLGQGNRANATIGRAVRLALQDLGDAFPGVSDMATMGQPGKFSWCFAENEAKSPFPPFHVDVQGFEPGSNAVTVMAAGGSTEVVLTGSSAVDYASCWGNALHTRRRGAQALVLLPPEPANLFYGDGWDRQRWRDEIFASYPGTEGKADDLLLMVAGGVGIKATFIPSWGFNSIAVTRAIEPL